MNSTRFPTPLLIGYSIILEEEGTQDGGRYNQEDTSEEPACCGLRGVGVPAGELAVGLDAAYQSEYRTDGVAEFGRRIKIAGHKRGGFINAGKPFALRENVMAAHNTEKRILFLMVESFLVRLRVNSMPKVQGID